MLIVMPRVVVRLWTDSFLTEVKEPNPRCAARNARQVKIINQAKAAHLVLGSMMWHLSDDAFHATTALALSCMRAQLMMHLSCSVYSFMRLFNDLNFKIMKLTLYAIQKIHCPFYFSYFVLLEMLPVDRARGDEEFELFLGMNNISRVVWLLRWGLQLYFTT